MDIPRFQPVVDGRGSINLTKGGFYDSLHSALDNATANILIQARSSEVDTQQTDPPSVATPPVSPQPCTLKRPRPTDEYTCDTCNIRTRSVRHFGNHMWLEHKVKAFDCPDCGFQLARYDNMASHRKSCKAVKDQMRRKAVGRAETTESKRPKRIRISMKDLRPVSLGVHVTDAATRPQFPAPTPDLTPRPSPSQPRSQPPNPQILSQNDSEYYQLNPLTNLSTVSELEARIIALEDANNAFKEKCSLLEETNLTQKVKLEEMQDDLEQARSERDVWYEQCKKLGKELRKRPKEGES